MSKAKAPIEIRKAKEELEQEISDTLYLITSNFHELYPDWMVTDVDLGIIDISFHGEQRRMTAASRVELTKKDLTVKICKGDQIKEATSHLIGWPTYSNGYSLPCGLRLSSTASGGCDGMGRR